MDLNQIANAGLNTYNSLPQSTQEAMLNPAAKTLGKALDGAVTVVCSPLLILDTVSKALLHKFSDEINHKISGIPQENRDTSKLGLVIKAMEEARYQLNKDDIRKMYVNLIASTVDNRKNKAVNPRFATVIAQLGSNEAKLLKMIYEQDGYHLPLGYLNIANKQSSTTIKVSGYLCGTDNGDFLSGEDTAIDIISSLGIIELHTDQWLSSDNYMKRYETIEQILKQTVNLTTKKDEEFELKKCYLKLNSFGHSLCHCIFE